MSYDEYLEVQTIIHGQIEKPAHYHKCERKAIDYLFKPIPKEAYILDVGCGSGLGMKYLRKLGFEFVQGIELHSKKAKIADAFCGDVATFGFPVLYDVIYCSHSFEHMFDPYAALTNLYNHTNKIAMFIFILPYPDTGDSKAHCASDMIGSRVDDGAKTTEEWFEDRGLELIHKVFSKRREPEVWLIFGKI